MLFVGDGVVSFVVEVIIYAPERIEIQAKGSAHIKVYRKAVVRGKVRRCGICDDSSDLFGSILGSKISLQPAADIQ